MTPRTQLAILASAMVLPAVMLNCAGSRADQESWPDASALPSPSSPSGQPNFGSVPAPDAHAASPLCEKPPQPADPALVEMSPAFSKYYETYLLGPVPGIPSSRLGGCVLSSSDPNTLLVAVRSEDAEGAIYAVPLKREACGHIVGFDGPATPVAQTPHVDANLIYGPNNVLFYSEWPVNAISQLLPNATSRARRDALAWIGVGGGGPGGLGFVPPNLQDPGGFRALTWSAGYWYHLDYEAVGSTFAITSATHVTTLPNGPGGFAYVPQGSPGFGKQSLITAEWSVDKVVAYDVDAVGDPVVATRTEFFTRFPKPWGAYFEPNTGDFIFLTWGAININGNPFDGGLMNDQLYIVQGFTPPPPPPPKPPG